MIVPACPYDANISDNYYNRPINPQQPLDNFDTIRKTEPLPYYYSNYEYPFEESNHATYHELVSPREYFKQEEQQKTIDDWTPNDTIKWIMDSIKHTDFSDGEIPYYNFNISGRELLSFDLKDILERMVHPNVPPQTSRRITEFLYEKLHPSQGVMSELESPEYGLSSYHRSWQDISEISESYCSGRHRESDSPESSSDAASKNSEDEDRKPIKRPPGRPKGSGRKVGKRPKSVSVPEFLRDLLLNPRHCPEKIRWENYAECTFRFVKPDLVAKLWGDMKQNENMTFEKFSRAMRYHYRGQVLVSVPASRLVYQFGPKGPDIRTDDPNFDRMKTDRHLSYS